MDAKDDFALIMRDGRVAWFSTMNEAELRECVCTLRSLLRFAKEERDDAMDHLARVANHGR